jgi:hypothetical protein
MAQLTLNEVRNPVKRVRGEKILAVLNAADSAAAAQQQTVYNAAGAVDPTDDVAIFDATAVGMAMTLADGSFTGEAISMYMRSKTNGDTVVLTPANLTGGTTVTFGDVGVRATLIWTGAAWDLRNGDAVVA